MYVNQPDPLDLRIEFREKDDSSRNLELEALDVRSKLTNRTLPIVECGYAVVLVCGLRRGKRVFLLPKKFDYFAKGSGLPPARNFPQFRVFK
jgi:hypothetical protein